MQKQCTYLVVRASRQMYWMWMRMKYLCLHHLHGARRDVRRRNVFVERRKARRSILCIVEDASNLVTIAQLVESGFEYDCILEMITC